MSFEDVLKNKDNLKGLPKSYLVKVIVYLIKLVLKQKKKLGDDDPSPTTPSSQIPPYRKPGKKKSSRKKKNGQKKGHKGKGRGKAKTITHHSEAHPEGTCPCGGCFGEQREVRKRNGNSSRS